MSSFENWLAQLNIADIFFIPIKILIVIAVCLIAIMIGRKLIQRALKRYSDNKNKATLITVFLSFWKYLIYFIGVITVLSILNISIAPILASAGVVGIAIGFGAQNLVKDVIGGFFIIFDHYYAVGDYISTGSVSGYVQEIGLRSTKVKDWGGEVYIFPNGEVTVVTNYSKGDLTTSVSIPVSYDADLDEAMEIIKRICHQMRQEYPVIKDGPHVLGLDTLEEYRVRIKLIFAASLEDKFAIERELKKRIKTELTAAGFTMSASPITKVLADENAKAKERG